MPAYARKLYTGDPGTTWLNETGTVQFQLIVNWRNSCGLCCQYDHQIGPSWPLPYHRGCKCKQILIAPGASSQPFVDFMAKIETLDHVQQSRVIGRANLTLVEKGIVDWSDVVTRTRVRDFREVVALKKLTVDQLRKAGVNRLVAKDAVAAVNTPVHELAAQQRQELLAKLEARGLTRAQVKQALAERLAARVGIKAGLSGPGVLPVTPTTPRPPPVIVARKPRPAVPVRKIARPIAVAPISGGAPLEQYLSSLGVKAASIARTLAPTPLSTQPVLPGRPIAQRLAAWTQGEVVLARVEALGAVPADIQKAMADAQQAIRNAYKHGVGLTAKELVEFNRVVQIHHDAVRRANQSLDLKRQELTKLLESVDPVTPDVPATGPGSLAGLGPVPRKAAEEALAFLARVFGRGAGDRATQKLAWHPVPARVKQRSYARQGEVFLSRHAATKTAVHELAHWMEVRLYNVQHAEAEFWQHRVGNEQPTALATLATGYRPNEFGYKDKFDQYFQGADAYYAGKKYNSGAHEILSMGLQALFEDPVRFVQADREWAKWVIGMLTGALR